MAITIGLVEDHSEFRKSLEYLISSFSDYNVAWSYASVEKPWKIMLKRMLFCWISICRAYRHRCNPAFQKKVSHTKMPHAYHSRRRQSYHGSHKKQGRRIYTEEIESQ